MRVRILLLVGVVQACVIPPDLKVQVNESEYRAICHCETCTDYDPNTMACVPGAIAVKETDLTQCDDPSDLITPDRVTGVEQQLTAECQRNDVPGTTCDLAINDFMGPHASSMFLDLPFGENTCPLVAPDGEPLDRVDPGTSTQFLSKATVVSSSITLSSPDGSGTTSGQGTVEFIGGNCTATSCPFRVVFAPLKGTSFTFAGTTVSAPFFINTTVGEGTYFPSSGIFTIAGGTMQIAASGTVQGDRRGAVATSAATGFGLLNPRTRALVFAQTFTAGDITVDIQFVGAIDNLMPAVSLDSPQQIECNTNGGADVVVAGRIVDEDGRRHTSQWYVDGVMRAVNVDTLATFLPLGAHDVELVVFDEDGGPGVATQQITVSDTTPPTISQAPFCLWPPNHDDYVVDRSMLHVSDVCDANPTVTFVSGSSSESDDGAGDGNTSDDLVINPESVCVRSERSGLDSGRQYQINGTIEDAAGNVTAFTMPINVPHDQRHASVLQCGERGGEAVDGNDVRCQAHLDRSQVADVTDDVTTLESDPRTSRGCSTSSGPSIGVALAFLLILRRRRR